MAFRCEIVNYYNRALFNLDINFDIRFFRTVPVPDNANAVSHGPLTTSRHWKVTLPRLDNGPQNNFVFYFWECCIEGRFIQLDAPDKAEGTFQGESARAALNITKGDHPREGWELVRFPARPAQSVQPQSTSAINPIPAAANQNSTAPLAEQVLIEIQKLVGDGSTIQQDYRRTKDTAQLVKDRTAWISKVVDYLSKNVRQSTSLQFKNFQSATNQGCMVGYSVDFCATYNDIGGRMNFLSNLK